MNHPVGLNPKARKLVRLHSSKLCLAAVLDVVICRPGARRAEASKQASKPDKQRSKQKDHKVKPCAAVSAHWVYHLFVKSSTGTISLEMCSCCIERAGLRTCSYLRRPHKEILCVFIWHRRRPLKQICGRRCRLADEKHSYQLDEDILCGAAGSRPAPCICDTPPDTARWSARAAKGWGRPGTRPQRQAALGEL